MNDIKVGDTVYFHGNCLDCGKIFKTTVLEVASTSHGRNKYRLDGYDGIAFYDEIELTEQEAFREAERAKENKIRSLEIALSLLKNKTFEVFTID